MKKFICIMIIVVLPSTSWANTIEEPLYCMVQSFETILIKTNTTNAATPKKTTASRPIKVTYEPLNNDQIGETYDADSSSPNVTVLNKGYSGDATQYVSIDKPREAVTYFGQNDDGYHIVVKYIRGVPNDGSKENGYRMDDFTNIFMYCADIKKLRQEQTQ